MHGLVSLLPEPYYARVEKIWQELDTRFGLTAIQVTPYPHFSWQIGEEYPADLLEKAAQEVGMSTPPLEVTTGGLGVFTGEQPVIFISLVKSPALAAVHRMIWQRFENVCEGVSPLYGPNTWMPHISLAYKDVTSQNIGPVMQWLAFQDFYWKMPVNNISFICEPEGSIGSLQCSYGFCGEE